MSDKSGGLSCDGTAALTHSDLAETTHEAASAAKDKQLEQLRQENAALRQRLDALEKAVAKIINQ